MYKRIITYGTFDLFHYGHYNLLKRASELENYLIVGVSSDEMCMEKDKVPFLSQNKRMEIISSLSFVNEVILEKICNKKFMI
ncbi:MAG: adenylyltransferase/cytidyltransferase family protein [Clostridia bacterium]|nr:adenylyltransferase/cytidyltransferase family protein [Clostridia bacterium]